MLLADRHVKSVHIQNILIRLTRMLKPQLHCFKVAVRAVKHLHAVKYLLPRLRTCRGRRARHILVNIGLQLCNLHLLHLVLLHLPRTALSLLNGIL